jgi:FkbM family methyltransferase
MVFPNNSKYLSHFPVVCKGLFEPISNVKGQWRSKDNYQGELLTRNLMNRIADKINFDDINVIFDIGSRDALQSVEFASWFPNAKVYAFEANPDSIKLCTQTMDRYKNESINITLAPYAANNYNGDVSFYPVFNGNIGASSLLETTNHTRSRSWKQTRTTVPCVRVDDWCKEHNISKIDILWMDVQGAEKMVLEGIGDLLNSVKVIQTEIGLQELYKNQMMKTELDSYLAGYGFEMIHGNAVGGNTEMDVIYIKNDSKISI